MHRVRHGDSDSDPRRRRLGRGLPPYATGTHPLFGRVPLRGSHAAHLVGLITSWPRRLPHNQVLAAAEALPGHALRRHLASRRPPRARLALGDAGEMLVPFDWRRVASTPASPRRSTGSSSAALRRSPSPQETLR